MILFDRQAVVVIGNKIYKSDEIDIEFNVPFSTKKEPNSTEISIYNLSPPSIASIKKGTKVSLSAGYNTNIGMLASGEVSDFITTVENVDKKTTMKLSTGITAWQDKKIQKTYAPGTTAKDIFSDLIPSFGVAIGELNPVINPTYSKGKTVSGRLKDIMIKLATETKSKFYLDKGRAYIRATDKGTETGFLLSGETGLLGTPEKTQISEDGEKPKDGWSVKCLLNHNIGVDSLITIKSKSINGKFRVVSGTHTSEWITNMKVI